ncbi:MAG TPA: DUF4142 domain-containing protein [Candidatus Sulfotelmatobacter sp.]|nr:DUF4142 domain-containing protein [Candidatus Sulfotelmatobacter sp.]
MHRTAALAIRLFGGTLGLAALAAAAHPALAQDTNAKAFVAGTIRDDVAAVQIGQLAMENGGSVGVKDLGQTLDTDHSLAAAEASKVAYGLGMRPSGDLTPQAQREYDRLAKLRGPAFDREFLRATIAKQRSDIRAFTAEAAAEQGEASALAARQLPTLRQHLTVAEDLQREARMHSER